MSMVVSFSLKIENNVKLIMELSTFVLAVKVMLPKQLWYLLSFLFCNQHADFGVDEVLNLVFELVLNAVCQEV